MGRRKVARALRAIVGERLTGSRTRRDTAQGMKGLRTGLGCALILLALFSFLASCGACQADGAGVGAGVGAVGVILLFGGLALIPGSPSAAALEKTGTPVRAMILAIARTGTRTYNRGLLCEQRQVTVDAELPGRGAYVWNATAIIPKGMVERALPGTWLDCRVDLNNTGTILVVGPGGVFFTG